MEEVINNNIYPMVKQYIQKKYNVWSVTALYQFRFEIASFLKEKFCSNESIEQIIRNDIFLYAPIQELEGYFCKITIEKTKNYFNLWRTANDFCKDLKNELNLIN